MPIRAEQFVSRHRIWRRILTVSLQTLPGCAWSSSIDSGWLAVTSSGSGNASATVGLAVAANAGVTRVGHAVIAGQSFVVTQGAAPAPASTPPVSSPAPSPPPPIASDPGQGSGGDNGNGNRNDQGNDSGNGNDKGKDNGKGNGKEIATAKGRAESVSLRTRAVCGEH